MRKKDCTAASAAASASAAGDGRDSTSSSVNRGRSIELPADCRIEPPEPPKHQTPIQTIAKKAGRRQRREAASQLEDLVDSVEKLVQDRIVLSRRARDVQNT